MSGLRLCRDCRWYRRPWTMPGRFANCGNHECAPVELNIVTGKTKQANVMCSTARFDSRSCGPAGKLWEPKP